MVTGKIARNHHSTLRCRRSVGHRESRFADLLKAFFDSIDPNRTHPRRNKDLLMAIPSSAPLSQ